MFGVEHLLAVMRTRRFPPWAAINGFSLLKSKVWMVICANARSEFSRLRRRLISCKRRMSKLRTNYHDVIVSVLWAGKLAVARFSTFLPYRKRISHNTD